MGTAKSRHWEHGSGKHVWWESNFVFNTLREVAVISEDLIVTGNWVKIVEKLTFAYIELVCLEMDDLMVLDVIFYPGFHWPQMWTQQPRSWPCVHYWRLWRSRRPVTLKVCPSPWPLMRNSWASSRPCPSPTPPATASRRRRHPRGKCTHSICLVLCIPLFYPMAGMIGGL